MAMHLLTWHGTVVCRADARGSLRHEAIHQLQGATPKLLPASLVAGRVFDDPELGSVALGPGNNAALLTLSRDGLFMCAERPNPLVVFGREEAKLWEMFLPLGPGDLRDLRFIIGQSWIVAQTRKVLRRGAIVLQEGFGLRIGGLVLDLCAPCGSIVAMRDAGGRPVQLRVPHAGGDIKLVIAEARGSALLRPPEPGEPARQLADAIALALHRHVAGTEPAQAVFDRQAALIGRRGVLAGIEDVLEELCPAADALAEPDEAAAALADPKKALEEAVVRFSLSVPSQQAPYRPDALLDAANERLRQFSIAMRLTTGFSFGVYDRDSVALNTHPEVCLLRYAEGGVRVRLAADANLPWNLMKRSLSLIYLLDAVFAPGRAACEFLAELGDDGLLPSIAFSSPARTGCLVPDPDFMGSRGYEGVRWLVQNQGIAWGERTAKVFWRGSTTGPRRKPPPEDAAADDFTWLPRLDLCRRARDSAVADYYDVGISAIVQMPEPGLAQRIERSGLCRAPAHRSAFLAHKAVLVIDGNSNAWSALFCGLLSGACILLVESRYGHRQWYYDRLHAWQHYVPVRADLRDLDRVATWVLENDEDARAIGEASRAFAEALTFEAAVEESVGRLGAWVGTVALERK
jgi:hypothetical protein